VAGELTKANVSFTTFFKDTYDAIHDFIVNGLLVLQVAIENWAHDLNIGSVVRTANAFGCAAVHIVGRRRWNRRGAMVTDRYQHEHHHPDTGALVSWAAERDLPLIGIDNLPGAVPLETYPLPRDAVLVFGQEGPGLSEEVRSVCRAVLSIAQYGSTRSINAGAAAAFAMHAWVRAHVFEQKVPETVTPPGFS
jgi:tRNA G18 (ribose-2'-O)-methylase SpoU